MTELDDVLALPAWADFGGPMVWHDIDDGGWTLEQRKVMAAAVNYLRANGPAIKAALEDARRYRTVRSAVYRDNVEIGEARLILRVTGACPDEREFDAAIDAAQEVGRD